MVQHLKTIVMDRLKYGGATFVNLPATSRRDSRHRRYSGPHSRGVRYFRIDLCIKMLWGAMDSVKEGQKYKKRIVVRPSRFRDGLFELYTYHFPKTWSAACVANREMIKEAQRQAHALEHSSTPEALDVAIYRALQAAKAESAKPKEQQPTITDAYLHHLTEEVTFEPIYPSRSPHPFSRYYANGIRLPISVST